MKRCTGCTFTMRCFNNLINSGRDIWSIYSVRPLAQSVYTSHVFAVSTMGALRSTHWNQNTHMQSHTGREGDRRGGARQGHASNMRKWSWSTEKKWRMNYGCWPVTAETLSAGAADVWEGKEEKKWKSDWTIHSTPLYWESAASILR